MVPFVYEKWANEKLICLHFSQSLCPHFRVRILSIVQAENAQADNLHT